MTGRPAFEPSPARVYWQAEIWHEGRQVYSSGPVGPGIELRAPIRAEGGSWLAIRWLTSAEAQDRAEGADPAGWTDEAAEFARRPHP